jgi:DNA-binding FadR family transcriptional regulator
VAECQTELFEMQLNGDFVAVTDAQTEPLNLQESADDLWMAEENLQSMADDLSRCSDKGELAQLRQCWSPQAMNAACKRLAPEKYEQIKQWVIELNSFDS